MAASGNGPTRARAFFHDVREAAISIQRVRRQLEALDDSARYGVGSGIHERVSTSGNNVERRTISYADQSEKLEARMDRDYRLIDIACCVLYGPDQDGTGGLSAYKASVYADVIWWRYVAAEAWKRISSCMDLSVSQCQRLCKDGLAAIDKLGLVPSDLPEP